MILALLALPALVLAAPAGADTRALAWEVVSHDTPRVFWAGRNRDVRVVLRNVGSSTWSEDNGDHLSYHWLAPDGSMVELDGMRARFASPVRPGETAEVVARVHAPSRNGRWVLEWEMVREQVAWYGPPAGGARLRLTVLVLWRCGLLQAAFLALTGGVALAARRWRPAAGSWRWALVEFAPVVWTWGAVLLVTVVFSEITEHQLWVDSGVLAASGAAWFALPIALVPGRWRSWAAFALAALVSLGTLADAAYMRFFENVVPIVAVAAARQLGQVEGSVRTLLHPIDLWLVPTLASGALLAWLWPRAARAERPGARVRRTAAVVAPLLCVAAAVPSLRELQAGLHDPATAEQLFSKSALLERWGLVNVHLFDVMRTWDEWIGRNSPDPRETARVRRFFAERAAASAGVAARHGEAKGANLILIQVESLQQWVVGAKVRGAEITPFLNSLREKALYFPFVFDQTGQGRSSDGEFAVLNSQHALDRGAVAFRRTHNHFVALPEVLREHGYHTLSAHPFEKGFWNRGVLHPRWGFEKMLFKDELGPGEVIGWGLSDGAFFDRMVDQLRLRQEPYFAFLITLGLHHPFAEFPDRHEVLDVGELKDTPLGNYIHAMHYFDASLADFIADLDRYGELANTVVALYGDHESGLEIDDKLVPLTGQRVWDPSLVVRLRRVPFFVILPGMRFHAEVRVVGGQVDIAPTLLALLGLTPPAAFVGTPLDPARAPFAVLNDGSAVGADRLYAAEGAAIPPGGACFGWPGGAPRPLADCAALIRQGQDELEASRFVIDHDLAREIAPLRSP